MLTRHDPAISTELRYLLTFFMKRIISVPFFLLVTTFTAYSQLKPVNKNGVISSTFEAGAARLGDSSLYKDSLAQEHLVKLALEGPQFEISAHEITKNKLLVKKAKNSWFDLLTVSTNYNDQTFAKNTGTTNTYVYPKYYFGVTLPLGLFFTKGADIKTAKENVKISEANRMVLARTIRAEVLTQYRQYKTFDAIITLQRGISDDQYALMLQTEKLFGEGKLTSMQTYTDATKSYINQQAAVINLQLQKDLVQIELEKMIGINLDTALSQVTATTATK